MPQPSFQTVVLRKGRHESPDAGACVVELASMLADEPFSDRPRSVCRVIAAFLRAYNDLAGDRRRDLYPVASTIVGTRRARAVERRRIARCLEVLDESSSSWRSHRLRRWLLYPISPERLRALVGEDPVRDAALDEFGFGLAYMLKRRGASGHAAALALVRELAAIGADAPRPDDVPALAGVHGRSMADRRALAEEHA
jgi:hypothetical protein